MTRKKQRTAEQKELALHDLLVLMRRGLTKSEAAEKLGVNRLQVYRDWEEILHRLNEDNQNSLVLMLAQYAEVKKEAWAAWERSKENKERTVAEKVSPGQAGQDKMKAVKVTEGHLPENSYLETVRKILDKECELRGLNPPKHLRITVDELDRTIESELARMAIGLSGEAAGAYSSESDGA